MCKKNKGLHNRIDKCIKHLINYFNENTDLDLVASCCGHGKYPMTIICRGFDLVEQKTFYFELLSDITIPRTRNFYKKDKQGYYFIPEVLK